MTLQQQTSIDSFCGLSESFLSDSQQRVYDELFFSPSSNSELSQRLGWSINRVCPRVLELREKGLVRVHCEKTDTDTNRRVTVWRVVLGVEQ